MKLFSFSMLAAFLAIGISAQADYTLSNYLEDELIFMRSVYRSSYAPAEWKQKTFGWNVDTEINKSLAITRSSQTLTVPEARQALKSFIYSMKDYHVSIRFQSTEEASLPFVIKTANNKCFFAYIDRTKLPATSFPFRVGDELASFGGKPCNDAVNALQSETTANVAATDHAEAELFLTSRSGAKGQTVPSGPITLQIIPRGATKPLSQQLIWNYTPEKIADSFDAFHSVANEDLASGPVKKTKAFSPLFDLHMNADIGASQIKSPFDIGAKQTFTPDLGLKIWQTDDDDPFYAYMYKGEDRRIIGYVRIPSYSPADADKAVAAFANIIDTFEKATDAIVIDQVNNPGGSVFYLYALASMLSEQSLFTPQHRMAITQEEVKEALDLIPQLEKIGDDATARKALGATIGGYPVSYTVVQFFLNYSRFIVNEWTAGRHLTNPYYIAGVDRINPSPVHYTKPILLLINNLDFSGGDFFPAIMQDNKRVTVMGARTAGAGGYVKDITFPNPLGIQRFRVTESIAERISTNPIENLGVTPDIEQLITEDDLTHGYRSYVRAVQTEIQKLAQ